MKLKILTKWVAPIIAAIVAVTTQAADSNKPNILVIMGDDIGMWNIGAYHRGLMAGKTPNLDKIAKEGMLFTDYYAEASCTAGRAVAGSDAAGDTGGPTAEHRRHHG